MTFASRRTSITNTSLVEHILRDDDYDEVPLAQVLPGDIAIDRAPPQDGGEIEHSGMVIERPIETSGLFGFPRILSKRGGKLMNSSISPITALIAVSKYLVIGL